MLKEICTALLQSDVNVRLVKGLRQGIKTQINLDTGAGLNKRRIIQKAVFDALCHLVDPGTEPFKPVKV
jgi:signal recognition particle subunit SRP54